MPWLQLHAVSTRSGVVSVEEHLLACGALSVTMTDNADNPILEPGVGETPLWDNVQISALFETDADQASINLPLQALLPEPPRWERVEDKHWEREWMADFQAIPCGNRLWICPSWQQPPNPQAVNLLLDPGLAFGSGTHPTTFLCLQWLDSQPLDNKVVIDYGCGSGILGIAALLLGAKQVIAIDNDPQALLATRDNLHRNHLADDRLLSYLPEDLNLPEGPTPWANKPPFSADIMIANILAEPLINLAPHISDLTTVGGQLCLSGILSHQSSAVKAAYPAFTFSKGAILDDWARLDAHKKL